MPSLYEQINTLKKQMDADQEELEDLEELYEQQAHELKDKLETELEYVDIKPYSHNLVAIYLQIIDKDYPDYYVDFVLCYETELRDKGWGHLFDQERVIKVKNEYYGYKARTIQRAWKRARYNKDYYLCRKIVGQQLEEMGVEFSK